MTDSEPVNPYAAPTATVEVPQERERRLSRASRGERFVGRFIDNILALLLVAGAGLVAAGMGLISEETLDSAEPDLLPTLLIAAPGLVLYLLIQGFLLATRSQSVGKIIMKTRIDKVDGSGPAGPVATIGLREVLVQLISFIPLVGGLFGLIDALFIFGSEVRCIHDYIAGTVVNKLPRPLKRRSREA